MRTALALLLFVAGTATAGAAFMRSGDRIRPASPWSISQRLAALRIERALPLDVREQATLSFEDRSNLLRVRGPRGTALIRCPAGADLADALRRYSENSAAPGCETQALDGPGDLTIYEVSGRVPPLCPGEYSTLTEEQLDHALYLPAVQPRFGQRAVLQDGRLGQCAEGEANCALFRAAGSLLYCGVLRSCAEGACFQGTHEIRPDEVATSLYYAQARAQSGDPSPSSPGCGRATVGARLHTLISEAITATTARSFAASRAWSAPSIPAARSHGESELADFFAHHPRGICFLVDGVDLERPRDAEAVAEALAFPVFAAEDPLAGGRASPFLSPLQAASGDAEAVAALFPECDLIDEGACRLKRERIAAQLRASLGNLQPALANLSDDELPLHLGASGPFHLAERDAQHLTLESSAPRTGTAPPLRLRYQPLWPELLDERQAVCEGGPETCLFRSPWNPGAVEKIGESPDDRFESLVGLFTRNPAHLDCVRRLFNALAAAEPRTIERLQRELRANLDESLAAAPCDPRARGALGLIPRARPAACGPPLEKAFGDTGAASCEPLRLVYSAQEPWSAAAESLAAIAARAGLQLIVSSASSAEVHRESSQGWDLALTVAGNYYDHRAPSLVSLLQTQLFAERLSGEPEGERLLAAYKSSTLYPSQTGSEEEVAGAAADRMASLRRLEQYVARNGRAPIYPLAFLRPAAWAVPPALAKASSSPWYLAQLPEAWSGRR